MQQQKYLFSAMAFVALTFSQAQAALPTLSEAKTFIEKAEETLLALNIEAQRAEWVKSTYITDDTETLAAIANERAIRATMELAKKATRFDRLNLDPQTKRKMQLLKLSLTMATPNDAKESQELTQLVAQMEGIYGKGKYCTTKCLDLGEITKIMADDRDPKKLLEVWKGWHSISVPMKTKYQRFVELSNKGARELGFADMGALWKAKYDMSSPEFSKEIERLWTQVKPLYISLHAYVRNQLREKYQDQYGEKFAANGPIPAHLLGNMWAQSWENIYPLVAPANAEPNFDLTKILVDKKVDAKGMVRMGEQFFTSLGLAPLPESFWEKSLFKKPSDREVVCHASAWDLDYRDDIRIKMCIEITGEEFTVVHHELGHNFYQRAYQHQPMLFREGANDGFHEAVGDTIALSITPEYLSKIDLLKKPSDPSQDIGLLLHKALEKIAFLPFGLLIDQWRWDVFSGKITPEHYNEAWWALKLKYQGVAPAVARSEADFDAGAKYHVPANVPYIRYFLADVLQFQFHRALAKEIGCTTALHRCSIYADKRAGKRLNDLLAAGAARPWQETLKEFTGQDQMDATAILEYFAPLQKWLDEQNKGKPVGW
jgi:peptidyl-dipeptidase A